jgi:hypothetical protein
MMESIYLMGSEDVRSASSTMSRAAEQMQGAASNVASALEQHQRFLDDWLSRFEAALAKTEQSE